MKVKVWCEGCSGTGFRNTCVCEGKGYTLKDLYELDQNQDLPENPYYVLSEAYPVFQNALWKVSEVARQINRSERWLRTAEAKGKIPKARRDLNGWRVYTEEDIKKISELLMGARKDSKS